MICTRPQKVLSLFAHCVSNPKKYMPTICQRGCRAVICQDLFFKITLSTSKTHLTWEHEHYPRITPTQTHPHTHTHSHRTPACWNTKSTHLHMHSGRSHAHVSDGPFIWHVLTWTRSVSPERKSPSRSNLSLSGSISENVWMCVWLWACGHQNKDGFLLSRETGVLHPRHHVARTETRI